MKRELILIRHTKSSWADVGMRDFDRPLKKDRTDDALRMGAVLSKLKLLPDLILCSPALRTRQTAEYFCKKLNYDYSKIEFDQRLYESSAEEYRDVIGEVPENIKMLIVIGHNPSITHFANYFQFEKDIDEVPTTGVVWFEFNNADWQLHRNTPCKLKHYLTPKTI
ncbi:MAG TPA: histidine phosphatase family protein [Chitinophagales bacterium]|nr:histidine phosphatase family protein [Chitinophagales bacterium]